MSINCKPDRFGSIRSGDHGYHTVSEKGKFRTDKSLNKLIDKAVDIKLCLNCKRAKCTGFCNMARKEKTK